MLIFFFFFTLAGCYESVSFYSLETYHPVLERYLKDFQKQVQMTLAGKTGASPLRFQNPQITYSPQFTYYIGTIVEQAPYLCSYLIAIS